MENFIARLSGSNVPNIVATLLAVIYLQIQIEDTEAGIRQDMTQGFADVREEFSDVRGEISEVREEMNQGFADVREELAGIREDVYELNGRVSRIEGVLAIESSTENRTAPP